MKPANHWANQIQNELRGDIDGTSESHYLIMVVSEIQEDARKELGEAKAQLEGVARVMDALQAEKLRIRKIAAHIPPKVWLEAEYEARGLRNPFPSSPQQATGNRQSATVNAFSRARVAFYSACANRYRLGSSLDKVATSDLY